MNRIESNSDFRQHIDLGQMAAPLNSVAEATVGRALPTLVHLRISHFCPVVHSSEMPWSLVRLELASNAEFPRGSAGRAYLLRIPLADDGRIDMEAMAAEPGRANFRRYWANDADQRGEVVTTLSGLALRFEAHGANSSSLFRLNARTLCAGEHVTLVDHDGRELPFRVVGLRAQS